MTTRTELGLTLDVESASPEELMRGLRAAIALFDAAGVTPRQAAAAHFKREGWDESGFAETAEPIAAEMRAADHWDGARKAAIEACCAGWPELSKGYLDLELDRASKASESR